MEALLGEVIQAEVNSRLLAEREFEARLPALLRLAFRVALGVLHQREEAEDAAQEALLRAHRDLGRMRDLDRIEAWLVRVVWRLAIDRQRLMRRRRQYELTALAGESQAESRSASREFEEALHEAVDALPEKLRSVIVLAAIHGYNTAETAKLLGVPEGTVKSRLHSARRKLAEKLARFRT